MDRGHDELIKLREVMFCALNPDPRQAHTATLLLQGLDGIVEAEPLGDHLLQVRYDVTVITLRGIEEMLVEVGFHLASNLMSKLKRALYYYTEDTQRANLGLDGQTAARNVKVFVQRYQQLRHGCRDDRPEHWRNYL